MAVLYLQDCRATWVQSPQVAAYLKSTLPCLKCVFLEYGSCIDLETEQSNLGFLDSKSNYLPPGGEKENKIDTTRPLESVR